MHRHQAVRCPVKCLYLLELPDACRAGVGQYSQPRRLPLPGLQQQLTHGSQWQGFNNACHVGSACIAVLLRGVVYGGKYQFWPGAPGKALHHIVLGFVIHRNHDIRVKLLNGSQAQLRSIKAQTLIGLAVNAQVMPTNSHRLPVFVQHVVNAFIHFFDS